MSFRRALRKIPIVVPALLLAIPAVAQASGTVSSAADHASQGAARTQAPLTPAQAKALSRNVTHKVIILFRNQVRGLPDTPANAARRGSAVRAIQSGVLAELKATHAANVKSMSLVDAVAATVSAGEAKRLAANPAVSEVTPDLPIPVASSAPVFKPAKSAAGVKPLKNACPTNKNAVQLNPEAIEAIHAATQSGKGDSAQALGYTGANVKVAYIADGIDTNNPDFIRANGKPVFVDNEDFSGTGTSAPSNAGEAFLDASSIAAQGRHVYNVQNYGVGLSVPCRIRILGVAPGASLVGLNVFGSANVAFNSVFLEAINYAVTVAHVNVLNESFGSNPFPDLGSLDLTRQADDAAVAAGVTVTTSTGDAGVTDTIGSPATDPAVISAGATTTYRSFAQSGIGFITTPGVKGWINNNISALSSAGFDQAGGTVDVVAPGDSNWALCTPKPALYGACTNFANQPASVELTGGTSESSPLTAGVAALVIQAYKQGHNKHLPTPAVVKKIIVSTAQDVSAPADQQGAGMIDAYAAVLAAKSWPGTTKAKAGHAVVESSTQFNAVAAPSTSEHFSETLTNDGTGTVTEHLSSRTLSAPNVILSTSATLTKANGFATEIQFTVPAGQARLNVGASLKGAVFMSLIAPDGDLAENNSPQGFGNYGDDQVANPAAGQWTILLEGESLTNVSSLKASLLATSSTWQSFGALSTNSVTLAAGKSASFSLTVPTPATPGDQSGSIVLSSTASEPGFAKVTTVPVTLRSLVPSPNTTFSGSLTGGNGRSASTGVTEYYQFNVSGQSQLNAAVSTLNSGNTFFAELVDPAGEAVSSASNALFSANAGGNSELVPEEGANLHVLSPASGRWTLIIDFYNSVSGTAALQKFNVALNTNGTSTTANGLPSPGATVSHGSVIHASVTITNSSTTAPEEYFIDPRLDGTATVNLAAQSTSSLKLPNLNGIVPLYLVPPLTTKLSAKVTAPAKAFFDLSYPFGDPDLISSSGKTSAVNFSANDIPNGDWAVTPFLVGPDGANGAKAVTAHVSVSATTHPVDSSVHSPTGDLWAGSTNPGAGFTPYVVDPGQTITIPVTITVPNNAGATVTGTLYVGSATFNSGLVTDNDLTGNFPTSSYVAAFPYSYKIG
jgi:hypothetical protein